MRIFLAKEAAHMKKICQTRGCKLSEPQYNSSVYNRWSTEGESFDCTFVGTAGGILLARLHNSTDRNELEILLAKGYHAIILALPKPAETYRNGKYGGPGYAQKTPQEHHFEDQAMLPMELSWIIQS